MRQNLLAKLDQFQRPALCTLTVDPKRFSDAQAAYRYVSDGGYIAELFRRLGVPVWVKVLEFQKNGWPHWHILLDTSKLPRGWIDYELAHHLWEKWGIGVQVDFQRRKFANARHALFYISKYLTKMPKQGFPRWVLEENRRRIRFVDGSKAVGSLVGVQDDDDQDDHDQPGPERAATRRTTARAMAECGQAAQVFKEETDTATGEVRFRYCGSVDASPGDLVFLNRAGKLRASFDVESDDDGRAVVLLQGAQSVQHATAIVAGIVDQLAFECAEYREERLQLLADVEAWILDHSLEARAGGPAPPGDDDQDDDDDDQGDDQDDDQGDG